MKGLLWFPWEQLLLFQPSSVCYHLYIQRKACFFVSLCHFLCTTSRMSGIVSSPHIHLTFKFSLLRQSWVPSIRTRTFLFWPPCLRVVLQPTQGTRHTIQFCWCLHLKYHWNGEFMSKTRVSFILCLHCPKNRVFSQSERLSSRGGDCANSSNCIVVFTPP